MFWCCCGAAALVCILAATEERFSSVTFVYILALLRGSGPCQFSGCYGGAVLISDFCLYSGVAAGQQPLSIFWLLRRSGSHQLLFFFFFFFFIYHPKILKVYKTTTTVKLEYTKEIMSFVARKDTRSSSSHYERHITKIEYNNKSSITKKNIHYKNLGVPGASKIYISDSPGKADFHSANSSDWA